MKISTLRIALFLLFTLVALSLESPGHAQSARPDLDIQFVTFRNYTTSVVIGGRPTTLYWSKASIFVQNRGAAASTPCSVRMFAWQLDDTFRVGSPERTFVGSVPIIQPGQTATVDIIQSRFQFDFVNEHRVNLTLFDLFVDSNFQVLESNENNNTHTVWGEINN